MIVVRVWCVTVGRVWSVTVERLRDFECDCWERMEGDG